MTGQPAMVRPTLRRKLVRRLRELDRRAGKYDRTLRIRDLLDDHGRNDWGHRLMTLVGRQDTGSWGVPRPRDVYWQSAGVALGRRVQVTRHAMTGWDGVRQHDEDWKTIDSQDDGSTLRIGRLGHDGRIHDGPLESREEIALLRRWLMWDAWVKAEWFGLRPWLYYKGLHAAVHRRRAFTCQEVPGPRSDGYDHWHCEVPIGVAGALTRRLTGRAPQHKGRHRFAAVTWKTGGRVHRTADGTGRR